MPRDIKYVTLINPGEYIKDSIANVMHEVWLCSFIAVLVLFLFIGSFAGSLTTLIEIPVSIILSFILMKLTNIQLNLISLGGLALSVGMNVDASVVVIDAIIKKLVERGASPITLQELCPLVASAVRSVFAPVILATITSLIVFVPLIFTSELSYAILGDLAKTVIYSHGLSLFIALLIVPTVRIHLLTRFAVSRREHRLPVVQVFLQRCYDFYCTSLLYFLRHKKLQRYTYVAVATSVLLSVIFIPPRLNREIISAPDTHIISTHLNYQGSSHVNEMEAKVAEYEQLLQDKYGKDIDFIFSQVYQTTEIINVM